MFPLANSSSYAVLNIKIYIYTVLFVFYIIGSVGSPVLLCGIHWSVLLFVSIVEFVKVESSHLCYLPYTVWVKKVSPLKLFCNIFTCTKYISVKFCQFITSTYPHRLTSFRRFNLIFNKMALIFLGVVIVFTVSSFDFQQVRLLWLHR